jgi:glycosyltransferase involved in cell wall biosynthesis
MAEPEQYIPSNFKFCPMRDKRSKVRKLIDMYRGVISGHFYFVREHLRKNRYDVVVIDHSFTGAGLPKYIKQTGSKLITIHHNVERDYLRDNSREKPLLYRFPFLHFSKKAERECLRYSDISLTVTEHDAKVFRSWYRGLHVYSWGIFEHYDTQLPVFEAKEANHTFVITGSLYFRQSLKPIIDFVRHYWPLVLQLYPDAKLIIAGRNPAKKLLKAGSKTTGVTVIPNPDKIVHVVCQADYYVCPIYAGSGLKLRLFDGLRQGLPVLCHEVAANGYEEVAAKGCIYVYHDDASFIEALQRLTSAKTDAAKVFQAYKDSFALQTGQQRLTKILRQEHII